MQLYADIVLPLAQPVYTFAVPGGTDVAPPRLHGAAFR